MILVDGRTVSGAVASNAGLERHGGHADELRHHHATLALSVGVNAALVAERLGVEVRTLPTTYAHVIRNDDDRVRAIGGRSGGI